MAYLNAALRSLRIVVPVDLEYTSGDRPFCDRSPAYEKTSDKHMLSLAFFAGYGDNSKDSFFY